MNNIIQSLQWRYAVKKFDPSKRISDEQLSILLESLRLTPSSFWLQPWAFVLVEDVEIRNKLLPVSYHQSQVVDASHLLVLCRKTNLGENLVEDYISEATKMVWEDVSSLQAYKDMILWFVKNTPEANLKIWAEKQVYIALWNIMTVAANLEIDSCPMEWFSKNDYDSILWLEKLWLASVVTLPLWYRSISDPYAIKPKIRYELSDLVYHI